MPQAPRFMKRESQFGAALALPAGAADAESAGEGEAAGGVSPPPQAATMAPVATMAARSATITMFFMIVFSSERPERRGSHVLPTKRA